MPSIPYLVWEMVRVTEDFDVSRLVVVFQPMLRVA